METCDSFVGPVFLEAFSEEEERKSDEQDADGDSGAERPVIGRTKERLHDVGDHGSGRAADKQGRQEIAERENECEGGSGQETGHGKRENYSEESGESTRAEILRSLDERARDVFEGGVNGEEDEGRVDVREH